MLITTDRPIINSERCLEIAEGLFALSSPKLVKALPSYLDQNFLVAAEGQLYVLKIANPSEEIQTLEMQNQAMQFLEKNGLSGLVPSVFPSKLGNTIEIIKNNRQRLPVRLLSYLPGEILAHVKPLKAAILTSIGQCLGKVVTQLKTFEHPAAHRFMQWDLQQGTTIISQHIQYFKTDKQKHLIQFFFDRYQKHIEKKHQQLPKSIIHADANDYNVLVKQDEAAFGKFKVGGLLDFGDMVYTQTINELAIAIAYVMENKVNPLEVAVPMVAGFNEQYPLSGEEIDCLFDLACLRLCQTLTVGAHRRQSEPENAYRDKREEAAWDLLEKLKDISPAYAAARFSHECGMSAHYQKNLNWIKENQQAFGLITPYNFKEDKYLVFDLSVASKEFVDIDWEHNKPAIADHLVNRMKTANAVAGITRYDEPRLFFYQDKFKSANEDFTDYRNVHLGMDLIMEVGTPVYAALDGVVHHIIQNDATKDLKNAVLLKHQPASDIEFYTIYGNIESDLSIGDSIKKGTQIGQLVFIDNWSSHLHFQIALDLVGHDTNFPVTTIPTETIKQFWTTISPNPNIILQFPEKELQDDHYSVDEITKKRSHLLGKNQKYYYQNPINLVRSKAQWFYDDKGQKFLDSLNNVTHVGHCHPKVVEAISQQAKMLNTNTRLVYEQIVKYAERLVATLPDPLSICYFVCTGSEANDLALRLARHYTGQQDMLILDGAYHGNTTAVEQISPNRFDGPGGKGAMSFIHKVPQPNVYRGLYQADDAQAGAKYALEVQKIINRLQAEGKGFAGFIAESLMGTAGQVVLPDGFLKKAYEHVRAAGGVCIADEVQVGFGRMGTHWWCFETQNVIPDVVVMGKPIANGLPMAMVVTTPEIAAKYNTGMKYFNTFGGNPVSCAAAMAVMDVIEEEGLKQNALETGNYFLEQLEQLKRKHSLIGDVRGKGLYLGIEFVTNRQTKTPAKAANYYISERMKEKGIIIYPNGKFDNCLKIKPPMVFNKADVDFFVTALDDILQETVVTQFIG